MRGSSHKALGRCTAPLDTPGFCFSVTSTEEMLQPLGPSPCGTGLAAVSQPGDRPWARASPSTHGVSPHTYPVPRECPQKRMLLFPLRALAQS